MYQSKHIIKAYQYNTYEMCSLSWYNEIVFKNVGAFCACDSVIYFKGVWEFFWEKYDTKF